MPRWIIVVGIPRKYISIVYRRQKANQILANKRARYNRIKLIIRKRGGL